MSFETMATLTARALLPSEYQRIEFIWHGGEPLLMGKNFYLKALYVQQELRQNGQYIRNSMQTNGSLLDDNWCEFFNQYGFHVGVSLDGPKSLHNASRIYESGKGSYDDVLHGIRLLQKHKVRFGVLMVITHDTLKIGPEALFQYLINNLNVNSFALLPARPDNVQGCEGALNPDYISPQEYSEFMKRIFDLWYDLDDPTIRIRDLTSLVNTIVGGSPTVCTLAGQCTGEYFAIEPNGDVFHCDKFRGDPDYHIGNILTDSYEMIRASEKMYKIKKEEKSRLDSFKECDCFNICNGGCPHDAYVAKNNLENYDDKCCGSKDLIEHMQKRITEDILRP